MSIRLFTYLIVNQSVFLNSCCRHYGLKVKRGPSNVFQAGCNTTHGSMCRGNAREMCETQKRKTDNSQSQLDIRQPLDYENLRLLK